MKRLPLFLCLFILQTLCLFILQTLWLPAQEADWTTFESIGWDRDDPSFLTIIEDGKRYYLHLETSLQIDDLANRAADLTVGMIDGYYGVVRNNGHLIVPFEYDDVALEVDYPGQWYEGIPYRYIFVVIKKDSRYGIVDGRDGRMIAEPDYEALQPFNSQIIMFRENGLWGWIDADQGEVGQAATMEEQVLRKSLREAEDLQKEKESAQAERNNNITVGGIIDATPDFRPANTRAEIRRPEIVEEGDWYYVLRHDGSRYPIRAKSKH